MFFNQFAHTLKTQFFKSKLNKCFQWPFGMFAGKVRLCEHTETNAHEHTPVQKTSTLITEHYPKINIKKKKEKKKVAQS